MEKELKKLRGQLTIAYPWLKFVELLMYLTEKLKFNKLHKRIRDYGVKILDWRLAKFKRIFEIQSA